MLSHSDIENVVGNWIVYTTEHGMKKEKKELWLLYDFLKNDLSKKFYRSHYKEVKNIIEKLDDNKKNVPEIKKYMLSIIEKYR